MSLRDQCTAAMWMVTAGMGVLALLYRVGGHHELRPWASVGLCVLATLFFAPAIVERIERMRRQ